MEPQKHKRFLPNKSTSQEKTEKLFTYGAAVVVYGILLSVFQQAIGINAVLYYAPRIFENAGAEGGGMMQTVIMGIVNIVFTLIAIFTVDRFGRKPLLIIGSVGMAVGAFAVALCDRYGHQGATSRTVGHCICSFLHDVMGTHLLGTDIRNLSQHHPWQSGGHCCGISMDIQLHCFIYVPRAL